MIQFHRLGEAEVEQFHDAILSGLDIRGFQIPMHDSHFVRGFERFGNLPGNGQGFIEWRRTGTVLAFDQFHHDGAAFDAINRRNIVMIERRENLRFALKAGHTFGVIGERGRQDFQRELAAEIRIGGAIHLAHPSHAQRGDDFIRPDFASC